MKETVRHYTININNSNIPPGGFRAVFISDMHNRIWKDDIEYTVSLIEDEAPDIILCGGDMLVGHPSCEKENIEKAGAFIKSLSERFTVYYAMGNHEYRLRLYPEVYGDMYDQYMDCLKEADIIWLDNACARIEVNQVPVNLYGLSISRKYYRRLSKVSLPVQYIKNAVGPAEKSELNILLAHHPKYIGSYFKWGADIVLSGHYHGGIMQLGKNKGLISPDLSIFPHLANGCLQKNEKTAIVSAGMGEHTIPFRINNPREIVVFDVEIW